jgi:O-antigen/teichoic acid export membrane protein
MPKNLTPLLWYGFALIFTKAFALFTLPMVTQYLPPSEFGRLELMTSFIECAGLISGFAIGENVNRLAGDRLKRQALAGSVLLLGGANILLMQALLLIFAPYITFVPVSWMQASLLAAGLTAFIDLPMANLRVENRAQAFAVIMICRVALQVLGQYLLLKLDFGAAAIIYANMIVEICVSAFLARMQFKMTGFALSTEAFLSLYRLSLPYVLGGLAMFIVGNADRWFLVSSLPLAEIAFYGLALKLSLFVALFSHAFNMWWGPRKYGIYDASPIQARNILLLGGVMNCLGALFVWAAAPLFVTFILPATYAPLLQYLPFLVLISLLNETATLCSLGAFRAKTGLSVLGVNGAGAGVALLGYVVMIPLYGIWGAIYATLAAHSLRIGLYIWLCCKITPLPLFVPRKGLLQL